MLRHQFAAWLNNLSLAEDATVGRPLGPKHAYILGSSCSERDFLGRDMGKVLALTEPCLEQKDDSPLRSHATADCLLPRLGERTQHCIL